MLIIPGSLAEQKLKHFDSVSAFSLDYPAKKLHIVSDDSNTILRSPNNRITVMICIMCIDDPEDEPAASLVKLATERGIQITEADIPVFTTKGGGQAYQLREEDENGVSIDYMIREGDRDFSVNVMLSTNCAQEYEPMVHDVVLSIAVNPDMPYHGAIDPNMG